MRGLRRFAFAASAALLLCCVTLGIAYATGTLAGGHSYTFELPFKLSFPFAATVGIVAGVFSYRRRDYSAPLAGANGAAIGCLFWYLSERVIAMRFTRPLAMGLSAAGLRTSGGLMLNCRGYLRDDGCVQSPNSNGTEYSSNPLFTGSVAASPGLQPLD